MKLRTTRLLHLILRLSMAASVILFLLSEKKDRLWLLELVLLLHIILMAYLDYNLWRCPHCGYHLKKMFPFPKSCPHCGHEVRADVRIHARESRKRQKEFMEDEAGNKD